MGFAFVDDMGLCVSMVDGTSEHMLTQMQASVTNWEGVLWVIGRALVSYKCFWYLINHEWTNCCWKYKLTQQAPSNLVIVDDQHLPGEYHDWTHMRHIKPWGYDWLLMGTPKMNFVFEIHYPGMVDKNDKGQTNPWGCFIQFATCSSLDAGVSLSGHHILRTTIQVDHAS